MIVRDDSRVRKISGTEPQAVLGIAGADRRWRREALERASHSLERAASPYRVASPLQTATTAPRRTSQRNRPFMSQLPDDDRPYANDDDREAMLRDTSLQGTIDRVL